MPLWLRITEIIGYWLAAFVSLGHDLDSFNERGSLNVMTRPITTVAEMTPHAVPPSITQVPGRKQLGWFLFVLVSLFRAFFLGHSISPPVELEALHLLAK